ncbi:MAG: anaerobic ribonucleoside-triphosphate reductase activating protein [Candidatus Omnitrophota bacterium]
MRIGGFQKISLIDYPGKISAVVFTQGCNFRCPFCHNAHLVLPSLFRESLSEEEIIGFLASRTGRLQGVVITGGEPTLQNDLKDFIKKIKVMGYAVKLDTNGSRPFILEELIRQKLVDFVAMDVKAPIERYREVSGVNVNPDFIKKSIELLINSGLQYQFRTTFTKPLLNEVDLSGIMSLIGQGAKNFCLQPFVPQESILDDTLLDKAQYQDEEFNLLRKCCEETIEALAG